MHRGAWRAAVHRVAQLRQLRQQQHAAIRMYNSTNVESVPVGKKVYFIKYIEEAAVLNT